MSGPPTPPSPPLAPSGAPQRRRPRGRSIQALLAVSGSAIVLFGCGGGSGGFDNASTVANPAGAGGNGQKLSFAYFQRCVQPVLKAQLRVVINGTASINSCAAGGCHDNTNGTGGALRLTGSAADVDLSNVTLTPEQIRATEMYRNFYSSQGETVIGSPAQSRILNKPLVNGVLHGGGLIFENANDPNARILRYWISRPMPAGQDEFSTAANNLFTPANQLTGACNTD